MGVFSRNDIAVDLGTSNTIVRDREGKVIFCEATCIALENKYDPVRVICMGNEAKRMIGRNPCEIDVVNPLHNGVISDFKTAKIFMNLLIELAKGDSFAPRVGISIPHNLTQVERYSLYEATMVAGAKEVLLIEDPFSASVGIGLDIGSSRARMIIDAGGGVVEVSVIALGGLVASAFTKEAGDFIDCSLMEYCRHNKNIGISKETAEIIKKQINIFGDNPIINIGAKDLASGMPISCELKLDDFKEVLLKGMFKIKEVALETLNKIPPQVAPDLIDDGAILTGGMALTVGMKEFLEEELKIKIYCSPDPLLDISKGVCEIMKSYNKYSLR